MNTSVQWIENMTMLGKSSSGHTVIMDGPEALGGNNIGIRPMEMLLLGLGGCATIDTVSTLKKMREDIQDCQVQISAQRSDEYPKVFTKIHLHFVIKGVNLNAKKVAKAINLSATKYCSASMMLGKMAQITYDFELCEC